MSTMKHNDIGFSSAPPAFMMRFIMATNVYFVCHKTITMSLKGKDKQKLLKQSAMNKLFFTVNPSRTGASTSTRETATDDAPRTAKPAVVVGSGAFGKLLMNFSDLIRITSFVLETINNR